METKKDQVLMTIRGKDVMIDKNCMDMVNFFNNIGLDTKYCCEGHTIYEEFSIMFQNYVSDDKIIYFIQQYSNKYNHSPFFGHFYKWYRKMSGKIAVNWMYKARCKEIADDDYHKMLQIKNNIHNYKKFIEEMDNIA